jgi:ABC-type nickel/cobalt efflux system permease component RcnA
MRLSSVQAAMTVVTVVLAAVVIDSASHVLLAQNPFGGSRSPIEPQMSGVVGWLLTKQSEFYREMSSTIRAAKHDGSAVWSLLAISFLYGIFHAAGPGHGKAVISSYLVANQETARRGIILSFASALLQSLVAVLIVGIGAWFLNATAKTMCGSERIIEIASYALIAVFGARLVWIKGGGLVRALRVSRLPIVSQMPALAFADAPLERHAANDHSHRSSPSHSHDDGARNEAILHEHGSLDDGTHVHDAHCGHSHGPQPGDLAGPRGWQRGFSAILTVGIRPCSGAILVLVFALAQGLFWAGIAATFVMGLGTAITVATIAILSVYAKDIALRLMTTGDGGAALLSRGLEFAAAGIVLLFGVGLLFGYVAAERVTCF